MEPSFILRFHSTSVTDVCFSPDNKYFISGSSDGVLAVWDISIRRPQHVFQAHTNSSGQGLIGLEMINNDIIMSHGRDGFVKLWSIQAMTTTSNNIMDIKPITSINTIAPFSFCRASILVHDPSLVVSPSAEQSNLNVWDIYTADLIRILRPNSEAEESPGMCMAACNIEVDGRCFVFAVYENGCMVVFDVSLEKVISQHKLHDKSAICIDMLVSPPDNTIWGATGSADNKLQLWKYDITKYELKLDATFDLPEAGVSNISIRDDAKIVAVGCWDYSVRIFGLKKPKALAVLRCHTKTITALKFSNTTSKVSTSKKNVGLNIEALTGSSSETKTKTTTTTTSISCNNIVNNDTTKDYATKQSDNNLAGTLACGSVDCKISFWNIYPPKITKVG